MANKVDDVLEMVEGMSVLELSELVEAFEEKFGVSASAAPVAVPQTENGDDGGEEAKDEFDVVLTEIGDKKIQVIKVVRELTDLGLKEAKELVDNAPNTVREALSQEDAEEIKEKLEEVGATVELQ